MRFPKKGNRSTARRPTANKSVAKKVTKSLTKNQKQAVKQLIAQPVERKYLAQTAVNGSSVNNTLITPIAWGSCIPLMNQGPQPNARIGNSVRNVVGRTQFSFAIDGNAVNSQNFYVRLFLVQSKKVKSYSLIPSLPTNQLLDAGNNNTIDWDNALNTPAELSMMPLSSEHYTGKVVTFRLNKNVGLPIQDATAGNSPNDGLLSSVTYSHEWKHSIFKYDDFTGVPGAGQLPTNYAPLFAYVAYTLDGTNIYGSSTVPILATVRCEMSYTDE